MLLWSFPSASICKRFLLWALFSVSLLRILCSYRKHSAINLLCQTFRTLPKTLKIFIGSARVTPMVKWPLIFHNWHALIQIIGVLVFVPLTVNDFPLVMLIFRSLCKVAANHWPMPLHWKNLDKKWFVSIRFTCSNENFLKMLKNLMQISFQVHQYVGQEPSGRNFNELILDYNSEYLPRNKNNQK